jgi:predicted RNase H-like HicB family nuclease
METPPPPSISLSAEINHDGEQFIASCPEIPEAQGKGAAPNEALMDLRLAVDRYFENQRAAQDGEAPAAEA